MPCGNETFRTSKYIALLRRRKLLGTPFSRERFEGIVVLEALNRLSNYITVDFEIARNLGYTFTCDFRSVNCRMLYRAKFTITPTISI